MLVGQLLDQSLLGLILVTITRVPRSGHRENEDRAEEGSQAKSELWIHRSPAERNITLVLTGCEELTNHSQPIVLSTPVQHIVIRRLKRCSLAIRIDLAQVYQAES